MQLQQRINAFAKLGEFMSSLVDQDHDGILEKAASHNGWFTLDNIQFALKSWSEALSPASLDKWTDQYQFKDQPSRIVGIVMAGNIPLVGFHDFISVLICGHKVLAKLSSNDHILLPYLAERLIAIEPEFKELIDFTKDRMKGFDAVIATGSNNTARYFDHYFGKYPHIIRKNRNSIAVLNGEESPAELELLANDIFRYYGLGCRNVSKIYVPSDYSFDAFFNAVYSWKEIINQTRYMNNYDYNKAVYLMSDMKLLDNEFMLLKEDKAFASPISVVYYEYYSDESILNHHLKEQNDQIQVLVGNSQSPEYLAFGSTQHPQLWDYADGVDTVDFLLKLS